MVRTPRTPALMAALLALSGIARANVLGIHTMVQDNNETFTQLDEAAELCGYGGWVKQFMYVSPPGQFDARMRDFVDGARQRHLNVVARLHYIPESYRADPNNGASKPKNNPDGSFTSYKDLIRDYVRNFHGGLHYVEIWNEPNLAGEWNGQPDPEEFVRVMMAGYDGVKEADPACRVLFPGLAPTDGTADGRNINNLTFLRACFQSTYLCPRDGRPFKDHFDILGNHSYALNRPATYGSDKYSVKGYVWELGVCGSFSKYPPVLITECGYALGNHDDTRYPAVTEEFRAENMVIAFRDVWARDSRVLGAMPYFLHAGERQGESAFFWVRDDGSHTPQFDAVKALTSVLADLPGNYVNRYGNRARAAGFTDPVDIADVAAVARVALGFLPPNGVEPYRITTADVSPPDAPDGLLTMADALRILSVAAGFAIL